MDISLIYKISFSCHLSALNGELSCTDFQVISSAPRFQLWSQYPLQQEITPSCLSLPSFLEEDTIFRKVEVSSQDPLYLRPLQLIPAGSSDSCRVCLGPDLALTDPWAPLSASRIFLP